MKEKTIKIADFSRYPSGRMISDGPNSAERFRRDHLVPALEKYDKVTITLDGVRGYPYSFTEEVFGGLVRLGKFSKQEILDKIDIRYQSSVYEGLKNQIIKIIGQTEYSLPKE